MTQLKSILTTVALASAIATMAASPTSGKAVTASPANDSNAPTDSTASNTVNADSILIQSDSPYITIDGDDYILKDGQAFKVVSQQQVEDLTTSDDAEEFQELDFDYERDREREMAFESRLKKQAIPLVAMIFGIPCLTIVLIVCLLISFFIKRNREKNEIISKAIDANYTLPDAFFNPSSANVDTVVSSGAQPVTEVSSGMFALQPVSARDPKKFARGITLIGIGIPVMFFFIVVDTWAGAWLCGGTLIFIGIAQLLSYYYLPAFFGDRNRQAPRGPQPPFGPDYRPYYPGQYPPQSQQPQGYQGMPASQTNQSGTFNGDNNRQCPPPLPRQ